MIKQTVLAILFTIVSVNVFAAEGEFSENDRSYLVSEINKSLSGDSVDSSSIKHTVPLLDSLNMLIKGAELVFQVDYRVWAITFETQSSKSGSILLHKMWDGSGVDGATAGYARDIEGFDQYSGNNTARLDLESPATVFRFMATCVHSGWTKSCWNQPLSADDFDLR